MTPYNLVRTSVTTGKQWVWRAATAQEIVTFLATCRPEEVRQVYKGGTEVARIERLHPHIIDAACSEVMERKALAL